MRFLSIFICGLIFGLGLAISGMLNPTKVSAFLDLAGAWDPSLAFVMGGGLAVNALFFHLLKRPSPYFAETFSLPNLTRLDRPLFIGAALFGIGWAIAGLCPGPAIASLAYGTGETFIFFIAMTAGLALGQKLKIWL
jgi:uncharacterized membrane protein YedE/YeeE